MAGTVMRWEWYASSIVLKGYLDDFKLTVCQTGKDKLVADFEANYDGRTPRKVYECDSQYTGGAVAYTWWGFDFDPPFQYDGDDNLIIEVFWLERSGEPGVVTYWTPLEGRCCMYAGPVPCDPAIFDYLHYMRITISPTAVAPTSIGRVKALYR
jgi:hypothetical protein